MRLERLIAFIIVVCINFCICTDDRKVKSPRFNKIRYSWLGKKRIDKFRPRAQFSSLSKAGTRYFLNQLNSIHNLSLIPYNISEDPRVVKEIIYQYAMGTKREDVKLNIIQLITKYGYPVELHKVQTDDGYTLTLFRIPGNGKAVLLMHGLLGSADDWVMAGPESGIAYLLAKEGYDVWLGNARGNKHSRKHKFLSPRTPNFWDFSWDEIGEYDLPVMIDYILRITKKKKLYYVGHSQGTTSFFVMASLRPEYNNKISLMVALSAVAWMSHIRSPLARLFAPDHPFLGNVLQTVGDHEFSPTDSTTKFFQRVMCGRQILAQVFCSNLAFLWCGFSPTQLKVVNLPVMYGHTPSGASIKQLVHYGQEIVSERFQRFSYGSQQNMRIYGSEAPPDYPVEKITAPVAIFTSDNDWFANVTDVAILRNKLPKVVHVYNVPDKKFNHMDFIFSKNVKSLVFSKLEKLLMNF